MSGTGRPPRRFTPAEDAAIVAAYQAGEPLRAIATRHDRHWTLIQSRVNRLIAAGQLTRRAPLNGRPWTVRDLARLAVYWGVEPDTTVARRLGRTVDACKIAATRKLRQARKDNLLNARQVAAIFGVDPATPARTWRRRGWVTARRSSVGAGGRARMWWFDDQRLAAFIRERPWAIRPERMQPDHWLTALAQELHAADPWVTLPEAARRLGYDPKIVRKWLGRLSWPFERRPKWGSRFGPWQGEIVLRAATLPELARAIDATTHANRSVAARQRILRDGSPRQWAQQARLHAQREATYPDFQEAAG